MATSFWSSSHYKRWLVDRATLRQARSDDLQYVDNEEYLGFLNIFFANVISKLGKKLQFRQRVVATATVFFHRFYVKNSFCETDPFIVIAACCYVAAKAEEAPAHIKNVVTEARTLFSEEYNIKSFPTDNSKLAEMEFYLVDELECDLTVFHPYRTLMALCGQEGAPSGEVEAGEADAASSRGPRFWGTGEGKLDLQDGALQMAWFIINDTYRTDLCLLYPPHLIAIAAIYLTHVFHIPTRAAIQAQQSPSSSAHAQPPSGSLVRRSSRSTNSHKKAQPQDIVGFLAGLNVSLPLVATIAQEIISLYVLWDRYNEGGATADSARTSDSIKQTVTARSGSALSGGTPNSGGTPSTRDERQHREVVTPLFLTQLLLHMREARMADLAHPASGRPIAVNKMLERTQAAG